MYILTPKQFMRKVKFISTVILVLIVSISFGQTETSPTGDKTDNKSDSLYLSEKNTTQEKVSVVKKTYKKNNVKINLTSLLLKNYSFYYERMVTRKIGFSAGYRFMPETNLGEVKHLKTFFKALGSDDDDIDETLNKIDLKNNAITAEVRFYLGHKPGARGFYFSLMGRYTSFEFDYPYDYSTNTSEYTIPLKGKFNTLSGGIGFGSQWIIAKRVVLDLYILGGLYGKLKGDMNGNMDLSGLSAAEKLELESELEDGFTLGNNNYLDATVTNAGVSGKLNGPIVGIRAFGLSLGFVF